MVALLACYVAHGVRHEDVVVRLRRLSFSLCTRYLALVEHVWAIKTWI
jgi:hypothetical protein